jgi:HEPN domain-containing protein
MTFDPEREYGRWMRQARQDLEDARFCLEGGRYHLACFISQQAAEKALKAFLYRKGHRVVWGHSVAELLDEAGRYDPALGGLRAKGSFLDRFYIPTRYPNGLPGGIPSEAFTLQDAEAALEVASELVEAVDAS